MNRNSWISIIVITITLTIVGIFLFFPFSLEKYINFPTVEYKFQDAIIKEPTKGIDYIVYSKFASKGAFVPNNKVDVKIEVRVFQGEDFRDIYDVLFFIGKIGDTGTIKIDNRTVSSDFKTLTGIASTYYDAPGDYDLYYINFKTKSGKQYTMVSNRKVNIQPPNVLYQMVQMKIGIAAVILTLGALIIQIFKT